MSFDREAAWLADIVDNAESAMDYIEGMSLETFLAEQKTIDAVERCIERLAEASVRIGDGRFAELTGGLSLAPIRGMGNALRHGYDTIDIPTIFATVKNDLPILRAACVAALDNRSNG